MSFQVNHPPDLSSSSSSSFNSPKVDIPEFPYPPPVDSTWQQVAEFPSPDESDEEEWTEEVEYITFDFGHRHAPNPISSYSSFQLLGLNTSRPFLKIGNQIYRGEYESLVGTELIMKPVPPVPEKKEHQNRGTDDDRASKAEKVVYEPLTHTQSRIRWLPINLLESEGLVGEGSEPESSSPEDLNGTDSKVKKRLGASAGGRHWASHWTKFTPRANRPQHKTIILNPDDPSAEKT